MRAHKRRNHLQVARPEAATRHSAQPPFVGRAQELGIVGAALASAARGQGRAVFLCGEPGIGKTRLAQEALHLARGRGFQVLEGRAYALEATLAYGPIIAAFGSVLRRLDRARLLALTGGLPDLGRLFGDLPQPLPPPLGDAALEKTRLFEAVARLLERLARPAPMILFLDDLHWADQASLELLHYLARGLAALPVMLLGTYRPDEAESTRELRRLVQSLRRLGLVTEVGLDRLRRDDLVALIRGALGGEPARDLVDALAARTAGTPLFVEALLRDLLETGQLVRTDAGWGLRPNIQAPPPLAVRELILERLQRLDPAGRRLVDLLAVGGDATPHALLRAAGGLDEEPLMAALHELRAAGLVDEELAEGRVSYTVSHPLIQEVAYADLPGAARQRAHAAFAAALERLRPEGIERLAHHYHGAGGDAEPGRALEVFLAAGERVRELHASEDAARHLGAALALVRQGRRFELLPMLLERLGEAWERLGEGGAAVALWTEAVAEQASAGDTEAVARLHRRLALAESDRGHVEAAQAHLSAGLAALGGTPSPELADLLHAQTVFLGRLGDEAGVAAAAGELLAVAERLGSPRARLEAELAMASLDFSRRALTAARERAEHALPIAVEAGEPLLEQRLRDLLALVAFVLGDHRTLRANSERSLELARRLGAPALEVFASIRLVYADLLAGQWGDALRRSAEAVALARRIDQPRGLMGALAFRAIVLALRGEVNEAERCTADARGAGGAGLASDRHVFAFVEIAEATLGRERGDVPRALAAATLVAQGAGVSFLMGQALLGEVHALAADALAAHECARTIARFDDAYSAAVAAWIEGLAHQAGGEAEAANSCLARATERFAQLGLPFEAARARLAWATVTSDRLLASTAAREALATFECLGARPYAARARQQLLALGARPPSRRRPRPTGDSLSPREWDVARLVAEGMTNAAIAERLIVSPRTVTTHLEHIYTRLGIASRPALVRYVLERANT